jgi:DNA helicase-2/ATP-dependent DNA helicase PcrA
MQKISNDAQELSTSLNYLNQAQLDAVINNSGPMLVLAGAGTGKTKVLTSKISYILDNMLASAFEILAVTFTNKAAKEMLHRTSSSGSLPWLGTFHSIATKILRSNASLLGFEESFTIIDSDDQLRLIKSILKENNIDSDALNPKYVSSLIQRWKDECLLPEDLIYRSDQNQEVVKIYKIYQERLKSLSAADFGDLLLYNIILFRTHPHILENYQNRFKYVLVDEYQDTNAIQYLWLKMLAAKCSNICCVGDEDQSIYGWRGAQIRNILQFEQDFPGAAVIRLEQNYRSTGNILSAAASLIANNSQRLGKKLWTNGDLGNKVRLVKAVNDKDEADYIAKEIIKLKNHGLSLGSVAILLRSSSQTRNFEETFLTKGLPYKIVGGQKFYSRQEIRDIIAYIRLVCNPTDMLAFERIVNLPKRGIGPLTLSKIITHATINSQSPIEAIGELTRTGEIKGKTGQSLEQFSKNIANWSNLLDDLSPSALADLIINQSGYLQMWQAEKTIEAATRIENIQELIKGLNDFPTTREFLDFVSLISDNDTEHGDNMVSIMTIHAAKGLEFDCVFLPCWEEGIFPNQRSLDESGGVGLEEERRLAYVAITRAKKDLYISYCSIRTIFGITNASIASRFIKELPIEMLEGLTTINNSSTHNYSRYYSGNYGFNKKSYQNTFELKDSKSLFREGEKVFHEKFGYGLVTSVLGEQVEVDFKFSGYKTILSAYLRKAS